MDQANWAILLAALGFLLLAAVVFIPSGGIIFVLALGCLFGAGWCAWNAWWESSPIYFWVFVSCMVVALPITGFGAFRMLENKIIAADEADEQMTRPAPDSELLAMVGKTGETVTPLSPSGIVQVEGQRLHASSEGMIVKRGQTISVVATQGNHLVVRVASSTADSVGDDFADAVDPEEDERLDFDMNQG